MPVSRVLIRFRGEQQPLSMSQRQCLTVSQLRKLPAEPLSVVDPPILIRCLWLWESIGTGPLGFNGCEKDNSEHQYVRNTFRTIAKTLVLFQCIIHVSLPGSCSVERHNPGQRRPHPPLECRLPGAAQLNCLEQPRRETRTLVGMCLFGHEMAPCTLQVTSEALSAGTIPNIVCCLQCRAVFGRLCLKGSTIPYQTDCTHYVPDVDDVGAWVGQRVSGFTVIVYQRY